MLIISDTLLSPYTHFSSPAWMHECQSPAERRKGSFYVKWQGFVLFDCKKYFFPEKHRMLNTYVDFQTVSHALTQCPPIKPGAAWHGDSHNLHCLQKELWVGLYLPSSLRLYSQLYFSFYFLPSSSHLLVPTVDSSEASCLLQAEWWCPDEWPASCPGSEKETH